LSDDNIAVHYRPSSTDERYRHLDDFARVDSAAITSFFTNPILSPSDEAAEKVKQYSREEAKKGREITMAALFLSM